VGRCFGEASGGRERGRAVPPPAAPRCTGAAASVGEGGSVAASESKGPFDLGAVGDPQRWEMVANAHLAASAGSGLASAGKSLAHCPWTLTRCFLPLLRGTHFPGENQDRKLLLLAPHFTGETAPGPSPAAFCPSPAGPTSQARLRLRTKALSQVVLPVTSWLRDCRSWGGWGSGSRHSLPGVEAAAVKTYSHESFVALQALGRTGRWPLTPCAWCGGSSSDVPVSVGAYSHQVSDYDTAGPGADGEVAPDALCLMRRERPRELQLRALPGVRSSTRDSRMRPGLEGYACGRTAAGSGVPLAPLHRPPPRTPPRLLLLLLPFLLLFFLCLCFGHYFRGVGGREGAREAYPGRTRAQPGGAAAPSGGRSTAPWCWWQSWGATRSLHSTSSACECPAVPYCVVQPTAVLSVGCHACIYSVLSVCLTLCVLMPPLLMLLPVVHLRYTHGVRWQAAAPGSAQRFDRGPG